MFTIMPYTNTDIDSLETLYRSVGWISYLRRPNLLKEAFAHSLKVLAAYEDEQLVGLIRAVGDGVSILYIQDLLVHPGHQRKGIGTRLLSEMLDSFPDVNQTVLITDDADETVSFYEAAGFRKVQQVGCCSFIRLHKCYG